VDGDTAYLIAEKATAVIAFDLKQRVTKTLVSTRRKPAESPLDSPGLSLKQIWKNEAGEIVVAAETNPSSASLDKIIIAAWSSRRQAWRVVQELQLIANTKLPDQYPMALKAVGRLTGANKLIQTFDLSAQNGAARKGLVLHVLSGE